MANKQIKDFELTEELTGYSLLAQNDDSDAYNKVAAENLGNAITSLEKDVEAFGNLTLKNKSITFEGPAEGVALPPFLSKGGGALDYNNTTAGLIELNFTEDANKNEVWGIKLIDGEDAWGIKANGDGEVRNLIANTLDSNQINLVDMNSSVIEESTVLLGNHGGGYTPASIEIQNSDGAETSFKIPTGILSRKYNSMANASAAGVPVGGVYIQVDSLSNTTEAFLSVNFM